MVYQYLLHLICCTSCLPSSIETYRVRSFNTFLSSLKRHLSYSNVSNKPMVIVENSSNANTTVSNYCIGIVFCHCHTQALSKIDIHIHLQFHNIWRVFYHKCQPFHSFNLHTDYEFNILAKLTQHVLKNLSYPATLGKRQNSHPWL